MPWLCIRLALLLTVVLALIPPRSAAAIGRFAEAEECLALALYWEAKAEGEAGMLAVAAVVLNRTAHPAFPDTVCAVVTEGGEQPPCQFSWWCDGKSDRPTETRAWTRAQSLAVEAIEAPPPDPTDGALFFHNTGIGNPWVRKRERTVKIGRHIFYR